MKKIYGNGCLLSIVSLIAAGMCMSLTASAQRTMDGQSLVDASCIVSMRGYAGAGGSIAYGQYGINHYWDAFAGLYPNDIALSTSGRMDYWHAVTGAGYMYRLLSVRSRLVSLYAGGKGFIGLEYYDPLGKVPDNIITGLPETRFIYGISPSVEIEFFILNKVALVIRTEVPLTVSSMIRTVYFLGGGGLRIVL